MLNRPSLLDEAWDVVEQREQAQRGTGEEQEQMVIWTALMQFENKSEQFYPQKN